MDRYVDMKYFHRHTYGMGRQTTYNIDLSVLSSFFLEIYRSVQQANDVDLGDVGPLLFTLDELQYVISGLMNLRRGD